MIMRNLFQFVTAFTTMIELERTLFKETMMMMNRDLDLCQGLLFQGLGQAIQRLSRRPLGVTTTPRNPKFHRFKTIPSSDGMMRLITLYKVKKPSNPKFHRFKTIPSSHAKMRMITLCWALKPCNPIFHLFKTIP